MSLTSSIYSRTLSLEEIRTVYISRAHLDFPPDELKSFSTIERLWNNGCYKGYGFYTKEDHVLRAYALTMADGDLQMLLLDYFAVCEENRGEGYGTEALSLLKEHCREWDGIIFEVEDDESVCSEEERQIRKRRINFYERNGVLMTGYRSCVFGVDYRLMVLPLGAPDAGEQLGEKISSIYRKMLPEKVYQEMFRLR